MSRPFPFLAISLSVFFVVVAEEPVICAPPLPHPSLPLPPPPIPHNLNFSLFFYTLPFPSSSSSSHPPLPCPSSSSSSPTHRLSPVTSTGVVTFIKVYRGSEGAFLCAPSDVSLTYTERTKLMIPYRAARAPAPTCQPARPRAGFQGQVKHLCREEGRQVGGRGEGEMEGGVERGKQGKGKKTKGETEGEMEAGGGGREKGR